MISMLMCLIGLATNVQAAEFASGGDYSKGAAYFEANTLVVANGFHLNGEYRILPALAASGGLGFSSVNLGIIKGSALGGRIQMHVLSGKKKGHFEFALGAGYYKLTLTEQVTGTDQSASGGGIAPTYFIGYRLQPPDGGLLFRIGLGTVSPTPLPGISTSIGYSF